MYRQTFLTFLAIVFFLPLLAQSDSAFYAAKAPKTDTLGELVLHTYVCSDKDFLNSNQQIFVLEIPAKSEYSLKFAHEEMRTKTSEMAVKHKAVAAVNGSFFDMDKHFPICYLRIDSVEIGENTPGKDTVNRKYYQYGTICIDRDSVFVLKTDSLRRWEEKLPYRDIMTAGPLLILNHEEQFLRSDRTFVTQRHNRTALGIRDDGAILFVVADGRSPRAEGLTLFELQALMRDLGCRDAINLDGGGSTTLYLNYDGFNGVINCPSDNYRFDHNGERAVSNAVVLVRR